jgi:TPR repeat protein
MIFARTVLLATLVAASAVAQAQPSDGGGLSPPLAAAVNAYRAGDHVGAEASLRALAPGSPDAQAWLGALLLDRGANREGLAALQRAADAGSSEGAHRLGLVFAQGLAGTPRNDAMAARYFERAATAGHQRAQVNLGVLYFRGQGVPRDLTQARAWLEKAAAGGDGYALYALGRAMEDSQGQALADPVRATDLYRRAAEKGNPAATLRYGLSLSEGVGTRQDVAAAQRFLMQAHQNGVPEAALALGDMAARTPSTRDKAANEKVVQSAVGWYQLAARAGVPAAQFKLANAYFAGAGTARDPTQALAWYTRAAQQGLPEAQYALGVMLMGGVTGAADPVEGYKWLLISERTGHADSAAVRQKAEQQIPERDRKRAEGLAQAFQPTSERPQ